MAEYLAAKMSLGDYVLAYKTSAQEDGGPILMADGSVRTMTAEEFQAAKKIGDDPPAPVSDAAPKTAANTPPAGQPTIPTLVAPVIPSNPFPPAPVIPTSPLAQPTPPTQPRPTPVRPPGAALDEVQLLADLKSNELGRLIGAAGRLSVTDPKSENEAISQALVALMQHPNIGVQLTATRALSKWGARSSIPDLTVAQNDKNPGVRFHATRALQVVQQRNK